MTSPARLARVHELAADPAAEGRAYYNEIDPFAAQWLRNLIERDLIANGDVDERSILDVRATDLVGYSQCHFFAGIGGWSYALRPSVGPTKLPSGPDRVLVSRFRSLDSGKAMPTNDTSGPLFTASSPSARLQLSLENRLRAKTGVNGSPEYALTWKLWDMPAGPPICALRASARHTGGNGYIGWPTPSVPNGGRSPKGGMSLTGQTIDGKKRQVDIPFVARALLKGWETPTSRDWKDSTAVSSINAVEAGYQMNLGRRAHLLGGRTGIGALNPEFVCWLMGFPAEWDGCADTVTRSSRKSPRDS